MQVRITFRTEVYVEGETEEEIRDKFNELNLYNEECVKENGEEYVEMVSAERVDDDSYDDKMHIFY